MTAPSVVFVVNLLQDVNILRPLAFLAARETGARLRFLLTSKFADADGQGIWRTEVAETARRIGAEMTAVAGPAEAFMALQGGRGIMIAGSESSVSGGHRHVHEIFRAAPPGYLRVTLQHGLECVGFLHNRAHTAKYGQGITFAADVVCAWMEPRRLDSLVPSQSAKILVTGPTLLLGRPERGAEPPPVPGGLVCENLHSVRLRTLGDFGRSLGAHGRSFMDIFGRFCDAMAAAGEQVTLRPHPGGQYVVKNKVALPPNVVLANQPIYRLDLAAYDWGISAPSTVVLDMALAGIPVGVWQDPEGTMDLSNFDGLTRISTVEDWLGFVRDARTRRAEVLARQRLWLEGLDMPLDPAEVYRRFARLLVNATAHRRAAPAARRRSPAPRPRRVMFLANSPLPTLQIAFHHPLAEMVAEGAMETLTLTLEDMNAELPPERSAALEDDWLRGRLDRWGPDLVVACRYNGPCSEALTRHLAEREVPLVFAIDDDLLDVPREIGGKPYRFYRDPARRASLTHLLSHADLIYVSTPRLQRRLREQGFRTPMMAGELYCAAEVLVPSRLRPVTRIGYTGFDHGQDLLVALPGLVDCLRRNPQVSLDLLGRFQLGPELATFGDRVRLIPPIRSYDAFMAELSGLEWDIGICPLTATRFNVTKNNNKWVEYTAVGAATVATKGLVYDACGAEGRALLVEDDGWGAALQALIDDPARRHQQVLRAQAHLRERYAVPRLTEQVLRVFERAASLRPAVLGSAAGLPEAVG